MSDLGSQLHDRLVILIDQVQRDRAALASPEYAEGDRVYCQLFDSLQSTLHNLDSSEEAAKPCGEL